MRTSYDIPTHDIPRVLPNRDGTVMDAVMFHDLCKVIVTVAGLYYTYKLLNSVG